MPIAQNITAKGSIRKQRQNTLMIWVYNLSIMCTLYILGVSEMMQRIYKVYTVLL